MHLNVIIFLWNALYSLKIHIDRYNIDTDWELFYIFPDVYSLSDPLFIPTDLGFHWYHFSSAWTTTFTISYSTGLVIMNSFSFYRHANMFCLVLILKDIFAECRFLIWQIYSFDSLTMAVCCLPDITGFVKKSTTSLYVIYLLHSLYVIYHFFPWMFLNFFSLYPYF